MQHEVRALAPVVSEPGLSFASAGQVSPADARSERCPPPMARPNPTSVPVPVRPAVVRQTPDIVGLETDTEPEIDLEVVVDANTPHPTRGKTLVPEVLTDGEVRALIGACSKRADTGIRNKALLGILWRTGIRISEALDLMPYDVDIDRGTVRVRLGKGLKPRTTVLNNLDCVSLLEDWLRVRGQLDGAGKGASLFCTLSGTRVETSYVRHLMPRLAGRVGIDRRVHAHALRHTHAADLAIAGVPVLAIQRQLGHASLSTTSEYLKRVGVRLDMLQAVRGSAELNTPVATAPRETAPSVFW
ncbi:MAG: hypothetical protein COC22_01210 [Flavobacteriaceae bacterium]|nr:MAG: hypothetical protein COC22_01210 [Flavobacteriaceae bacterium]